MKNRNDFMKEKGYKVWDSFAEQAYDDYIYFNGSPVDGYIKENKRRRQEQMTAIRELNILKREYNKVICELDEIKGNVMFQKYSSEK